MAIDNRVMTMLPVVPVKVDDHGVDALRYGIKTTQGMWQPRLRVAA